jgi:hypothetical protein
VDHTIITRRENCILVEGSLSPEMLMSLTKEAPKGAVISPDVARLAGASWAIGRPVDLDALRAKLADDKPRPNIKGLSDGAAEWMAVGHHGLSSATLFFHATGVRPGYLRDRNTPVDHPHDPSDLNRCLLLIDMAPEIGTKLPVMRDVSPQWAVLVAHWDDLVTTFNDEAGPDWSKAKSAPRTYAMMRGLLDGVRRESE